MNTHRTLAHSKFRMYKDKLVALEKKAEKEEKEENKRKAAAKGMSYNAYMKSLDRED